MNETDKEAAKEKAVNEFLQKGPGTGEVDTIFEIGFDAGYNAHSGWVRIEGPDDLPRHNGFVDVTIAHPGTRYVSIARVLNGVWLDYLDDKPIPPECKIPAWRERPEPFTE